MTDSASSVFREKSFNCGDQFVWYVHHVSVARLLRISFTISLIQRGYPHFMWLEMKAISCILSSIKAMATGSLDLSNHRYPPKGAVSDALPGSSLDKMYGVILTPI